MVIVDSHNPSPNNRNSSHWGVLPGVLLGGEPGVVYMRYVCVCVHVHVHTGCVFSFSSHPPWEVDSLCLFLR